MPQKARKFLVGIVAFFGLTTVGGLAQALGWLKPVSRWIQRNPELVLRLVRWEAFFLVVSLSAYLSLAAWLLFGEARREWRRHTINRQLWDDFAGVLLYRDWRMPESTPPIRYELPDRSVFSRDEPRFAAVTCSARDPGCDHGPLQHAADASGSGPGYCCVRCGISYARTYPETVNAEALDTLRRRVSRLRHDSSQA